MPANLYASDVPYLDNGSDQVSTNDTIGLCVPITNGGDEASGDHDRIILHLAVDYSDENYDHYIAYPNLGPGDTGHGQVHLPAGTLSAGRWTAAARNENASGFDTHFQFDVVDPSEG